MRSALRPRWTCAVPRGRHLSFPSNRIFRKKWVFLIFRLHREIYIFRSSPHSFSIFPVLEPGKTDLETRLRFLYCADSVRLFDSFATIERVPHGKFFCIGCAAFFYRSKHPFYESVGLFPVVNSVKTFFSLETVSNTAQSPHVSRCLLRHLPSILSYAWHV